VIHVGHAVVILRQAVIHVGHAVVILRQAVIHVDHAVVILRQAVIHVGHAVVILRQAVIHVGHAVVILRQAVIHVGHAVVILSLSCDPHMPCCSHSLACCCLVFHAVKHVNHSVVECIAGLAVSQHGKAIVNSGHSVVHLGCKCTLTIPVWSILTSIQDVTMRTNPVFQERNKPAAVNTNAV
jgi:hypothetical protein